MQRIWYGYYCLQIFLVEIIGQTNQQLPSFWDKLNFYRELPGHEVFLMTIHEWNKNLITMEADGVRERASQASRA